MFEIREQYKGEADQNAKVISRGRLQLGIGHYLGVDNKVGKPITQEGSRCLQKTIRNFRERQLELQNARIYPKSRI